MDGPYWQGAYRDDLNWPHCAHHAAAQGQLPAVCFKASGSCDVWSFWPSPFQPQSLKQLNPLVSIFLGPLSIDIGTQVRNRWPLGSKVMSARAFLAFLGNLKFWMGMFKVFTWIGLLILIPKLIWKVPIGHLLEQFNSDWDVLQSNF